MPVYRLTASSIASSFRASDKRHLLLTGGRGIGKTTLLRALVPLLCPGAPELITTAYPANRVEMRVTPSGQTAVIGRFDPALPPGENRMCPVADGFLQLGVPALHRMAAGESEWAETIIILVVVIIIIIRIILLRSRFGSCLKIVFLKLEII